MTNEAILIALKEGNRLLAEYKAIVGPVADELARRKSLFVFGREGCYRGHLGCQEEGVEFLCLHIEDGIPEREEHDKSRSPTWRKAFDFEAKWSDKLMDAGIYNVHVMGHY